MKLVNTDGMAFIKPGSEWFRTALSGIVLAVTFIAIDRQLSLARGANAFTQLSAPVDEWQGERLVRKRVAVLVEVDSWWGILAPWVLRVRTVDANRDRFEHFEWLAATLVRLHPALAFDRESFDRTREDRLASTEGDAHRDRVPPADDRTLEAPAATPRVVGPTLAGLPDRNERLDRSSASGRERGASQTTGDACGRDVDASLAASPV